MVGMLVMSHGKMSRGLVNTMECIYGPADQLEVMTLEPEDNEEDFAAAMAENIEKLDTGDGVLVLVDILGGSPFKAAAYYLSKHKDAKLEVLAGMNLPMIITAEETRSYADLEETKKQAIAAGTGGIRDLRDIIK